jgi:mRNA interferase YafQ
MLNPVYTGQFKKDYKRAEKRGKDISKLDEIMGMLVNETPLPPRCREHQLHGNWEGYTECHIEGDWVLIYCFSSGSIYFSCTGTHSDYL